ncbi:hypothetical protein [Mucilaginibacter psychrotolerans]|uniref:Uncharacterized protein n=1 Tax=Mucilaginibacter psychrotolerans TaxID=1524096 RepID=A0A4Y8S813_9SPHI|nr:hypothetical protein [Mucilaginibacter psychrotolerans]TFF34755.1 hypothetical protein E2R66_21140 [Mucilaginibacter psychrotolerans]
MLKVNYKGRSSVLQAAIEQINLLLENSEFYNEISEKATFKESDGTVHKISTRLRELDEEITVTGYLKIKAIPTTFKENQIKISITELGHDIPNAVKLVIIEIIKNKFAGDESSELPKSIGLIAEEMARNSIYRQPTYGNTVQGLDLQLDLHTQKICETYNASSAATRSVLYLLLLVSVVSLLAVFNSNPIFNWPNDRMHSYEKRRIHDLRLIDTLKHQSNADTKNKIKIDSLARDTILGNQEESNFQKTYVDYFSVKVPIIGIQIDLNDMVAITALSFAILLYLLRFAIIREKSNLKLAFNSISERYPDHANFKDFKEKIEADRKTEYYGKPKAISYEDQKANKEIAKKKKTSDYQFIVPKTAQNQIPPIPENAEKWRRLIADINFTRRRSHYNFLSMNEIFNLPYLDISENRTQDKGVVWLVNLYLYYFFFLIYSYILFNDFCSYDKGLIKNAPHTFFIMIIEIFGYFVVYRLCQACINQKTAVRVLFLDFYYSQYFYDYHKTHSTTPSRLFFRVWFPAIFLLVMIGISVLYRLYFPHLFNEGFIKAFFKYGFYYCD